MPNKSAEDIAEILNRQYKDREIGSEIAELLSQLVTSAGYTNPTEVINVKKEVMTNLRELRR